MKTVSDMVGQTFVRTEGTRGDPELTFWRADGSRVRFYHDRECCEDVRVEDIAGDMCDIVGRPLAQAEETSNRETSADGDSMTWTFYKFSTVMGSVTIRWLGVSNGYYSESVDVQEYDVNGGTVQ